MSLPKLNLKSFGPSLDVTQMTDEEIEMVEDELDEVMKEPLDYATCTPDFPLLNRMDSHYVFIYDGLKEGFDRDKNLTTYWPCGVGYSKGHFELFKTDHFIPSGVAFVSSDQNFGAPLYGEVYCVTPETVRELDWLYSNTLQTRRLRTAFTVVVDESGTTKQIYAYVWVNLWSYWQTRLKRLTRCPTLTANNNGRKYHNFLKKYEQTGLLTN